VDETSNRLLPEDRHSKKDGVLMIWAPELYETRSDLAEHLMKAWDYLAVWGGMIPYRDLYTRPLIRCLQDPILEESQACFQIVLT